MRVTLSLLLAFVMSLLSSQLYCQGRWDDYDEYSPEDSLTTTHIRLFPRGGHSVPSTGIMRVCIIFVDREGEEYLPNAPYWPSPGDPDYQNIFIESINFDPFTPGFQWLSDINITKYFWDMSRGVYKYVGDVYRFTLPNPYPPGFNSSSYGSINNYILSSMDSVIDFGLYDNWTSTYDHQSQSYNHINQPDGFADLVFISYRSPLNGAHMDPAVNVYGPNVTYSGIASLITTYTSNDTLPSGQPIIVSNGTTQGGNLNGHLWARDRILHEVGHWLIRGGVGGHTGRIANLGLLNANQVGFDASKGMCAWERELMGWIDYTTITSDAVVNLPDMMTTSLAPFALKKYLRIIQINTML